MNKARIKPPFIYKDYFVLIWLPITFFFKFFCMIRNIIYVFYRLLLNVECISIGILYIYKLGKIYLYLYSTPTQHNKHNTHIIYRKALDLRIDREKTDLQFNKVLCLFYDIANFFIFILGFWIHCKKYYIYTYRYDVLLTTKVLLSK